MFLKNLRKSNSPTKLATPAFHTSLPSPYKMPKATIDLSLLSPFDKSKTFQVLNQAHQTTLTQKNVFHPLDIKIIDNTGSTSYSQTFRAYDKESNVLFAQKKLFLDSDSSWNQLNLILKQYAVQSPHLVSIYSLNFDEKSQEVNVFSQVNQNIIGDYSQFMNNQYMKWTDELLLSCIQQIRSQIRALRLLNAHCEGPVNPQNLFIDEKSHNLKVFDFSDFQVGTENFKRKSHDQNHIFLNSALQTLVKILNPGALCRSIEEAKSYLSRSHPSFYKILQEDFVLNPDIESKPIHILKEYDVFICEKLGLPKNSRVVNETENFTKKDQEENWNEVQEDFAKLEPPTFFDKLMAKISKMLFNITAKIFGPSKARKIAEVSKAVAWLSVYIGMLFGFLGILYFIVLTFGAKILEAVVSAFWPSLATAIKETNNIKQNDDKLAQRDLSSDEFYILSKD